MVRWLIEKSGNPFTSEAIPMPTSRLALVAVGLALARPASPESLPVATPGHVVTLTTEGADPNAPRPARPPVMPPPGVPSLWHGGFVAAAVFTPDGRLVTGAGDGLIRVWDPAARKELRRLKGHQG